MKLLLSFWPTLCSFLFLSAALPRRNRKIPFATRRLWHVGHALSRIGPNDTSLLGPESFKMVSLWTSMTSSVSSCILTLQRPSNESRNSPNTDTDWPEESMKLPMDGSEPIFSRNISANVHQIGDVTAMGKDDVQSRNPLHSSLAVN